MEVWVGLVMLMGALGVGVGLCRWWVLGMASKGGGVEGRNILLVTAHPDDESMFFVPFSRDAIRQGKRISLLCLSKGLEPGQTRINELTLAAKMLGFDKSEVYGVGGCLGGIGPFQDGFTADWRKEEIAEVVEHYSVLWDIDVILSFDKAGVSGHPNHLQTHQGVLHHKLHYPNSKASHYQLHSTPIPLKYLSWVGILLEVTRREKSSIYLNENFHVVWQAMCLHSSQFVWFRRLYLLFSTFVHLNILEQMN
uniref:N-acetylglucosaminylphosphatidylinositol deacetylase n=1 Tax=Arcella intermedia TaxID=1963864 RepID=A0A6B2LF69_9EUKA